MRDQMEDQAWGDSIGRPSDPVVVEVRNERIHV